MTNPSRPGSKFAGESGGRGAPDCRPDRGAVSGRSLFRTFSAEAYVVPTGSMAPTLLGHHRELTCPNCGFVFMIGVDEEGHPPRPVCPNCGKSDLDRVAAVECNGDRVLVQKFLYDFRPPRRWEVAVFHFPASPPRPT